MARLNMNGQLLLTSVLLVTLPAAVLTAVVTWVAVSDAHDALEEQAHARLVALRAAKKAEIERYFAQLRGEALALSGNLMVIDAMRAFDSAFALYRAQRPTLSLPQARARVTEHYREDFQREYTRRNAHGTLALDPLLAALDGDALALQAHYLTAADPPLPPTREAWAHTEQVTDYDAAHARYHPYLRDYQRRLGYRDVFLVAADSGDIVYSASKEIDFATSLRDGPFADSALGAAFRAANAATRADAAVLTDFAPYAPSYADPAAFIASPVYDGESKLGVVILQLPIDALEAIVSADHHWADGGLGRSGEVFLVGADGTMRSMARPLLEDREAYLAEITAAGVPTAVVEAIARKNTTIGLQPVAAPLATAALTGTEGAGVFRDQRGHEVLAAYAPLAVAGLDWAIVSQFDAAEAFATIGTLRRDIVTFSGLCLLALLPLGILLGRAFARSIVSPIETTVTSVSRIAADLEQGHADLTTPLNGSGNPVSMRLTEAVNRMLLMLTRTLLGFRGAAEEVAAAADRLRGITQTSATGMGRQHAVTIELSEAMSEMLAAVEEVARGAAAGAEAANVADHAASEGRTVVGQTIACMDQVESSVLEASTVVQQLRQDSQNIEAVLDVIRGIAEQTNLLALNAAIEAARAGEQGRGFAVVADEVRMLATRTQESTLEVQNIIGALRTRSTLATDVMERGREHTHEAALKTRQAGESLERIAAHVSEIDMMNSRIAVAAEQQSATAAEIRGSVADIAGVVETNARDFEQVEAASRELAVLGERLQDALGGHRIA